MATALWWILLCAAFGDAISAELLPHFDVFMQLHGRTYVSGTSEYRMRRAIYERHLAEAIRQNHRQDRLWTAGVNHLWDWHEADMDTLRGWDGSVRPHGANRHKNPSYSFLQERKFFPKEKSWEGLAVAHRPVPNQGHCGSCWAISSAKVLEAHVEIHTGQARTFSAQQMVECVPNPRECGGQGGCSGATAELAMDWVMKNGCANETQVPYKAKDAKCSMSWWNVPRVTGPAFGMTGWETLPANRYEPLVQALVNRGPVVVAVGTTGWQRYHSGIFDGCAKDVVVNHAVTALGYGEKNGVRYWTILNSWGPRWGEHGRIRVLRHDRVTTGDDYCGMNHRPQDGVACKGETEPVPVCGMCGVLFNSVVPHFK